MQQQKRQITFLKREEVESIISAIKPKKWQDLRDIALLEVLFSTGLRIAECLNLPDAPFVSTKKEGRANTVELSIMGKGNRQRTVYFSPRALRAIRKYIKARKDADILLFPFTPRLAQLLIKKRAQEAGIDKPVTPHTFRHSFATDLLRKGVDIRIVGEFLGHRSLLNTMRYTHIVNEQLKEIHAKLYT